MISSLIPSFSSCGATCSNNTACGTLDAPTFIVTGVFGSNFSTSIPFFSSFDALEHPIYTNPSTKLVTNNNSFFIIIFSFYCLDYNLLFELK